MSAPLGISFAWPGFSEIRNGAGSITGQHISAAESAAAAFTAALALGLARVGLGLSGTNGTPMGASFIHGERGSRMNAMM